MQSSAFVMSASLASAITSLDVNLVIILLVEN